jgi:hypothetical protein
MRHPRFPPFLSVLAALLPLAAWASTPGVAAYVATPKPACQPYPGPAVLLDLPLYIVGHPGTRVIDYGQRLPPDELQPPPGVECRVVPDTAPVAQWIARPPPNQSLQPYSRSKFCLKNQPLIKSKK